MSVALICVHLAVCAKAGKQSGAVCFKLPRAQFFPLLKLFPDEEESLAEAALASYDDAKSVSHHRLDRNSGLEAAFTTRF